MIISMIVAVDENNAIGRGMEMMWDLPIDMQHFKRTTFGHPVIMGRKTFESFGKPLRGRKNIVITRNRNFHPAGVHVVDTLDDALKIAGEDNPDEIFIIGGGEIYKLAFPLADRIYLTVVHHKFEGDVYFPTINELDWEEVRREEYNRDERHAYSFSIRFLERKK